jgi:hypothetical protein
MTQPRNKATVGEGGEDGKGGEDGEDKSPDLSDLSACADEASIPIPNPNCDFPERR